MVSNIFFQISVSSALSLEGRMSSVCWLICSPPYLERTGPLLPASCVLQLWRIFCLLAEMVEDEEGRLEVGDGRMLSGSQ